MIGLFSVPVAAQQAAAPPSTDDVLKAYRNDLQGARADIMAKNLTLTADQAAKFWPAYSKFQAEQTVIVDQQLQAMKKYADSYATLDDPAALGRSTPISTGICRSIPCGRSGLRNSRRSCRPGLPPESFRSIGDWVWPRSWRSPHSFR